MNECTLAVALILSVTSCATRELAAPAPRPVRVVAGDSGREVSLEAALDRLSEADAVFFGETHVDESTHLLELEVYEGLIERTGGRVILAMEMFSRDAQPLLDAYVAGEIDEAELLEGASPWGNYRTGYRAMVELARARGLPVVGSNVPAGVRRKVSRGGREAFEDRAAEERGWVAPELLPNSTAYWERFVRIVRGHAGQTTDPADYLYTGQSLWDNTMGYSCAEALRARPGWLVYHVNGRFHTDYGQGTVDQFLQRSPGATAMTITCTVVGDLFGLELGEPTELADYVAFVPDRARGIHDGTLAVHAGRDLRYRLHVPESASDANPLPLLVWLSGDGLSAEDALAYWRIAFRDEAIVAAVEPLYRAVEENLSSGGRWVWPETLSSDVSNGIGAAREVLRYVSDYYPVDSERVVLGGEGTGATVAAAAALFASVEVPVVAYHPRDFRRLRIQGLPEPGGAERELVLYREHSWDEEWWEKEFADYAPSGLRASFEFALDLRNVEDTLREQLELRALPRPSMSGSTPASSHELVETLQRRAAEAGTPAIAWETLPRLLAEGEASGRVIPVPEGPFGGTTVLVVLDEDPDRRAAWLALEDSDVMQAHGMMNRLRVAILDGEPSLDTVLADLHRSNVLIVPATDWAEADTMRRIRDGGMRHLDQMTVTFLPGLGLRRHLGQPERL